MRRIKKPRADYRTGLSNPFRRRHRHFTWRQVCLGTLLVPALGFSSVGLTAQATELRLNVGGADYTDTDGNLFVADKGFVAGDFGYSGGGTGSFTGTDVAGTTDDLLYQEMRGGTSFSYIFDNLPPADYDVTLYFMEPWWPAAGDRLFDVNIEGALALEDYDIVAVGGAGYVALTEAFAVTVTDGQLNIDFTGVFRNALVSAISVVSSAPLPDEPDISASPGSLDFGQVLVGASSDLQITITNAGLQTLTVDGLTPTMTDSIVVTPATPFDVLPGASENVLLRFSPLAEGLYSGSLEISSNDPDEGLLDVALAGEGAPEVVIDLAINVGGTDFADLGGQLFVADKVFVAGDFGYSGGGTGSFTGTDVAGTTDDLLYQEMRGGPSFSYIFDDLPPGDYDVTLYFMEPWWPAAGDRLFDVDIEGALVLADYDIVAVGGAWYVAVTEAFTVSVNDGQLNIDFTGVLKNALVSAISVATSAPAPSEPDIDASPGSLDFGQVLLGETSDQIITITNTGLQTLVVSGLVPTITEFSVLSPPTPFNVLSGDSQDVTVRFSTAVEGLYSGSLEITSNDPDEGIVDVSLTGEGVAEVVVELRINAGGTNFTDFDGKLFAADKGFVAGDFGYSGGGTGRFTGTDVAGTTDDLLYQEMRGGTSFSYVFDNLPVGECDVTLYFMEPWWPAAGDRLFDVTIEGLLVLDDYDIVAVSSAWYVALTETFSISLADGQLNIDFTGVLQNALVSAVSVVCAGAPPAVPTYQDVAAEVGLLLSHDLGGICTPPPSGRGPPGPTSTTMERSTCSSPTAAGPTVCTATTATPTLMAYPTSPMWPWHKT